MPFLFLCLLISSVALAQPLTSSIILKGRITDYTTSEPVSYATICLVNSSYNTLSNENGQFIFKIPSTFYGVYEDVETIAYSVDYSHGPEGHREGILNPGQSVPVINKMRFRVQKANRS